MTIQKANVPGINIYSPVITLVVKPSKNLLENTDIHPSTIILKQPRVMPMTGAIQKSAAGGVSSPMLCFLSLRNRSWVRDHRSPPDALAEITSRNPGRENEVSVATIRMTPKRMRKITPMSRREKTSKRKRKANMRTKMREEFFTIAGRNMSTKSTQKSRGRTVEGQRDGF